MPIMNWDDVSDYDVKPKGIYRLKVEKFEETETSAGYLAYSAQFRIVEPDFYAGQMLFGYYTLGTERSPGDPDPTAIGAREMKRLAKSVDMVMVSDLEVFAANVLDMEFLGAVDVRVQTKGNYAGQPRNNITAYYRLGEREPSAPRPGDVDAPPPKDMTIPF